MNPEQITNFTSDLTKARKTTLLIDTQPCHDKDACLEAARAVYDDGLPPGKTNLIYINALAEEYSGKFVLLDALLKELGQDLEQFNKIQSGVMAAKGLLSGGYSVAGLLTGGASSGFDLLMEKPLDYMIDKLVDIATDKVVDNGVDYAIEQAKDLSSKLSDSWFLVS